MGSCFLLNRKVAQILAVSSLSCAVQAIEVPTEIEEQYQSALSSRANGDVYSAIDQLNSLLTNSPTMHRARLELAVTYYRAAQYEQARSQAQLVLDNPETPDEVKQTVAIFIDQLDALQESENSRRHSWTGSISVGAGHDDNVNAGPSSEDFLINGLLFVLNTQDGEQSDAFATLGGRVGHTYRMPGTVDLGARPVQMLWQTNGSIYRREYQDEHPYTVDVISLSTGPALVSSTNWRAQVDLKVDYVRLGDDELATYFSVNPAYTWVSGLNEFTVRGQWMDRSYHEEIDKNREGERYLMGFDYVRNITGTLSFRAGASGYEQDGKVDYREYDVWEAYLSSVWVAWDGGAVYGRVNYRETDYDGLEPVFNEGREEDETQYVVGVSHNIKTGALQGWGIGANATYSENDSNIDIYEFDRAVFSFDVTKRF